MPTTMTMIGDNKKVSVVLQSILNFYLALWMRSSL